MATMRCQITTNGCKPATKTHISSAKRDKTTAGRHKMTKNDHKERQNSHKEIPMKERWGASYKSVPRCPFLTIHPQLCLWNSNNSGGSSKLHLDWQHEWVWEVLMVSGVLCVSCLRAQSFIWANGLLVVERKAFLLYMNGIVEHFLITELFGIFSYTS